MSSIRYSSLLLLSVDISSVQILNYFSYKRKLHILLMLYCTKHSYPLGPKRTYLIQLHAYTSRS